MKSLLTATVLATLLVPAAAIAQGCEHGSAKHAQISCAQGQTWDADTRSCITVGS
ncbi:MAG: hypothetical protein KDE08_01395 [Rhodobacteraceae bacterium]|nr:hypothetical protein [Paracoccaceae bacterium]